MTTIGHFDFSDLRQIDKALSFMGHKLINGSVKYTFYIGITVNRVPNIISSAKCDTDIEEPVGRRCHSD